MLHLMKQYHTMYPVLLLLAEEPRYLISRSPITSLVECYDFPRTIETQISFMLSYLSVYNIMLEGTLSLRQGALIEEERNEMYTVQDPP